MIKRIISITLVFIMILSLYVTSFAAEVNTQTSQKSETTVTYGMSSSYLVTIPDAVAIDADTGTGAVSVSVSNVVIPSQHELKVNVSGNSYANGQWHLTDISNSDNKIGYAISASSNTSTYTNLRRTKSEQTNDLAYGDEIFKVSAGEAWSDTIVTQLEFRLLENVTHAGNYADTITFTTRVVDVNVYDHEDPALNPNNGTTPMDGETYTHGDYVYTYYTDSGIYGTGWHVEINEAVTDKNQTSYSPILETINGEPVVSLYYTFYKCANLADAPVIPSNIETMAFAFSECKSLEIAPEIPNKVAKMNCAFKGCVSLTMVPAIPGSVTDMSSTFFGCTSLTVAPDMSQVTNLTAMGSTFADCKSLTTVHSIPNGVTEMYQTFRNCESLKIAPEIPNGTKSMIQTFYGCISLETAPVIPNSITDMESTFSGCTSLTTAPVIPNSVRFLKSTFLGCKSLTTAPNIPNSVSDMYQTFAGCTSLTTAPVIPRSVTNMFSTFRNCSSLTEAPVIPSSVNKMGQTFYGCTSLTGTITIDANPSSYYVCFMGVDFDAQNIKLDGLSTVLDELGATGTNYCTSCNGKCDGAH